MSGAPQTPKAVIKAAIANVNMNGYQSSGTPILTTTAAPQTLSPGSMHLKGNATDTAFPSYPSPSVTPVNRHPTDVYDSLLLEKLSVSPGIAAVTKDPALEGENLLMSAGGDGGGAGGRPFDTTTGRQASGQGSSSSTAPRRTSGSQRAGPQSHPSRRQSGRSPFPPTTTTPPSFYPATNDGFQPPAPPGPPPQYAPHASQSNPYPQRTGFGGQYTMSPQPPMPMVTASQQYAYSHPIHHPGMRPPDPNINQQFSPINYGTPSLAPHPMQPGAPIYQYQRYSPESQPSIPPMFRHSPEAASGSPSYESPTPSSSSHSSQSGAHTAPPYTAGLSPGSFSPVHYQTMTASPQFPTTYAHSSPSFYQAQQYQQQYPPYMPPSSPDDTHGQGGTWWYVPPGPSTSSPYEPYQGVYPMTYSPIGRPELDPYGNPIYPTPPSPQALQPPAAGPPQSGSPSASGSAQEDGAVSSPRVSARAISDVPSGSAAGTTSSERAAQRRAYHPNPPAHRSEWVMWVGNVPSDATHDELWRFFNQPLPQTGPVFPHRPSGSALIPSGLLSPPEEPSPVWGGVSSIFLISRSNCAFVNFEQEAHLEQAVKRFNGLQLRPTDARCPRLVCRVRRRDDDLKAGVGGQRGMGIHTRWVKDREETERASRKSDAGGEEPPKTPSDPDEPSSSSSPPAVGTSSDEATRSSASPSESAKKKSSSSGSFASTNSSFLTRHFPRRYFILKSLTEYDLNLSVERGVWATQPHNEGILNQAYRTSQDVFLIFGANKTGEFFGYARMAGPVQKTEERVSWASRTDSAPQSPTASSSSLVGRSKQTETIPEEDTGSPDGRRGRERLSPLPPLFSPSHQLQESPGSITPGEAQKLQNAMLGHGAASTSQLAPNRPSSGLSPSPHTVHAHKGKAERESAPAELHQPHRKITLSSQAPHAHETYDAYRPQGALRGQSDFTLDPTALLRRQQEARGSSDLQAVEEEQRKKGSDTTARRIDPSEAQTRQGEGKTEEAQEENPFEGRGDTWGTPFKIEWIRTDKLPFFRTRHLRNPWNHDREVKVSRDGTEIEPTVGQLLLDEWEKPPPPPTVPPTSPASTRRAGGSRAQVRSGATGAAESSLPSIQRVLFNKSQRGGGGRDNQSDETGGGPSRQ